VFVSFLGACTRTGWGSALTSLGRVMSSVTSPFDYAWPLSYRLPTVNNPLSPTVCEIIVVMHARRTKRHPATHPSCWLGNWMWRSDVRERDIQHQPRQQVKQTFLRCWLYRVPFVVDQTICHLKAATFMHSSHSVQSYGYAAFMAPQLRRATGLAISRKRPSV